jgi:hypothetical protein
MCELERKGTYIANMSNFLENKVIDFVFRGQAFTPAESLYLALCTSTPTDASTGNTIAEVTGGDYTRKQITSDTTSWLSTQGNTASTSTGTSGTTSNANSVSWTNVTWSATITAVALVDAASGGNVYFWGPLLSSKTVSSGDSVTFNAGNLSIQIDN